jgi:hypothetical protein
MKNIQHKAIGSLVQAFYHQKKGMGQLFLDKFGESTLNPAMSLVCCAVSILLLVLSFANATMFQIKCCLHKKPTNVLDLKSLLVEQNWDLSLQNLRDNMGRHVTDSIYHVPTGLATKQ